ncbi:D-Ala-D-Ala carboxypeptidase [Hyphomicrobium nitrativorans NL23]|uniref:D-Ala-D-Ala carboxypeptidase n=2 Tax=Hyphomicrobium TaxID=81 RepID=V5SFV7_9HYPH|nr:D-Ala-D-Ala carboxypeptidase [Hyphomicrobium nitrativorans NL23]
MGDRPDGGRAFCAARRSSGARSAGLDLQTGVHEKKAKQAKKQPAKKAPPPKQSSMIIDGNTGAVLHDDAADEPRFPASLTKVMTLYMLFSEIEQGRLSFSSRITASARAAAAPPSKLDLKPGDTITVADAVKALVVRSANDVAVAVAEHIGGSEPAFARAMTQRARQIGMTQTVFHNASGLPEPRQITTARDMLTLALRIQDDFPKHYHYFSTSTFTFGEKTWRSHNTLMRSFPGMDGMKTGYIRASGFNLVSSVRTGNKHIVGVVFGGQTAAARNAHMQGLLFRALERASTQRTRKGSQPLIARKRPAPQPAAPQEVEMAWATESRAAPPPPPAARATPPPVKAAAKAPPKKAASRPAQPPPPDRIAQVLEQGDAHDNNSPDGHYGAPEFDLFALREAMSDTTDGAHHGQPAPPPVAHAAASPSARDIAGLIRNSLVEGAPQPRPAPPQQQAAAADVARPPSTLDSQARQLGMEVAALPDQQFAARRSAAGGFDVQIGAYVSAEEAQRRIEQVRGRTGNLLSSYAGATIPVQTADQQIFRARFVNFDERSATSACLELRRMAIDCLVMRAE